MIQAALRLLGLRNPVPPTFARESYGEALLTQPNGVLSRTPNGPVLMLDFDGVLHPAQSGTLLYAPLLEAWLRMHPTVDVVISSNWRDTHTLDELRNRFAPDLQARIIGTTPSATTGYREDEILELVHKYRITRWAALDDRPDEFPKTGKTHLVVTEYFDGISRGHLNRVAVLLSL